MGVTRKELVVDFLTSVVAIRLLERAAYRRGRRDALRDLETLDANIQPVPARCSAGWGSGHRCARLGPDHDSHLCACGSMPSPASPVYKG